MASGRAPKLVRNLSLKVEHKIVGMLTTVQGTKKAARRALPRKVASDEGI